jgi:hypothetical protein
VFSFPGSKMARHEVNNLHPSSAEVKKVWSFTFTHINVLSVMIGTGVTLPSCLTCTQYDTELQIVKGLVCNIKIADEGLMSRLILNHMH